MIFEMSGKDKLLVRYNDCPGEISSQEIYQKFKSGNCWESLNYRKNNFILASICDMLEVDISGKNNSGNQSF